MNTNSDDILLLKLIKQGDQIAFRHLFYQYADSLERFITYSSMTGKNRKTWFWIFLPIYGKTGRTLR